MIEIAVLSLLVGSLGWQAIAVSGWLRWRQGVMNRQHREEEETLTCFESKDEIAAVQTPQHNVKVNSQNSINRGKSDRPLGASEANRPHRSEPAAPIDPKLHGWEYKIVRASRDLFRNPDIFQQLCDEEAIAGWILLEKLDDRRVRFKRPIALRTVMDAQQLSYDPYRTHYGSSWTPLTWMGAIAVLASVAFPSYLGYTLVSTMLAHSEETPVESPYKDVPPQDFPSTRHDWD
jgi:hypothetical protein